MLWYRDSIHRHAYNNTFITANQLQIIGYNCSNYITGYTATNYDQISNFNNFDIDFCLDKLYLQFICYNIIKFDPTIIIIKLYISILFYFQIFFPDLRSERDGNRNPLPDEMYIREYMFKYTYVVIFVLPSN